MTGILLVIGVFAVLLIVRWLISTITGHGVDLAGKAIGGMVKARQPQGFVAVSQAPGEVRSQLVAAGKMDPESSCIRTQGGVVVELTAGVSRGLQGFKCRWAHAEAGMDARSVVTEVVGTLQAVDPGVKGMV